MRGPGRHSADVVRRATRPDTSSSFCRIIGCGRPARASTADGLDRRYCRSHSDHHQRHGDHVKSSYSAADLRTPRREAQQWLRSHLGDGPVRTAVLKVRRLYGDAGGHREAFRLTGLPPRERAWAAWARLREAGVDPHRPIGAWLAIELAIARDPQPAPTREYQRVQAAKLVHKLASGTHKRWEKTTRVFHPNTLWRETVVVEEMHVFPRSRGRVLRHIGEDLEEAATAVADMMKHQLLEAQ